MERAEQLRPNCRIETETRLQWLREADALLRTKLFDRSAAGYFAGDKDVQTTASMIQSRVNLYVQEQR